MGVGGELVRQDVIDREQETDAPFGGFVERSLRNLDFVRFNEALAGGLTPGVQKCVGHGTADE